MKRSRGPHTRGATVASSLAVPEKDLLFCFIFLLGIAGSQNISLKFCYFFSCVLNLNCCEVECFPVFFFFIKQTNFVVLVMFSVVDTPKET